MMMQWSSQAVVIVLWRIRAVLGKAGVSQSDERDKLTKDDYV